MHGGRDWTIGGWLIAVAALQVAAFEAVRRAFVNTVRGQQVDTAALSGNSIGQGQLDAAVNTVLNTVTALSVVAATVAIGFIALMRGRVMLAAVATAMVVGANVTTQVLKAVTVRPELGIDMARAAAGNSLPSGHTTVTASVAVALVLVLPAAVRPVAAVAGAAVTTVVGVATMSAGWHRPSDAVAAVLVVGVWAALAGLVLLIAGRAGGSRAPVGAGGRRTTDGAGHRAMVVTLAVVGVVGLITAVVALVMTDGALGGSTAPEMLSRTRLFVAYAGGAAGIAGVTSVVTAIVLATVHRVVPARG